MRTCLYYLLEENKKKEANTDPDRKREIFLCLKKLVTTQQTLEPTFKGLNINIKQRYSKALVSA